MMRIITLTVTISVLISLFISWIMIGSRIDFSKVETTEKIYKAINELWHRESALKMQEKFGLIEDFQLLLSHLNLEIFEGKEIRKKK